MACAAAAVVDEAEDLLTCSVCFNSFDNDDHKPKYLSCHHTLCLACIKSISTGASSTCPLCRKETYYSYGNESGLANNPYALHMLAANSHPLATPPVAKQKQWCLKCSKEATKFCTMSEHSTLLMGTKPADFCLQIQQSKLANSSQTEAIIRKRKEAKKYFKTLSTALKLVEQNIKKLDEDNDLHLSIMISHLEASKSNTPKDETAKSFAKKVKESSDILKQELVDLQQLDDNYLNRLEKTKICVKFKNEYGYDIRSDSNLFLFAEDGLNTSYSYQDSPMLPIASFILISALNESLTDFRASFTPEPRAAKIPRLGGATNFATFDIDRSLFFLTFFHGNDRIGRIAINPDERFYRRFIEEFGQFCLATPTPFGGQIIKGHPGSFASVEFNHPEFRPVILSPNEFLMSSSPVDSEDALDVGFFTFSHSNGTVHDFQLIFNLKPLESFPNPEKWRSALFGRIVEGEEVLNRLSQKRISHRAGISVIVEFRPEYQ